MLPDTNNTGKLYRHWTYETYQCCALPVFAHELGSQSVNQSFFSLFSLFCTLLRGLFFCNWLSFLQVFLAFFQQFLETIDHLTVVCSATWPVDGSEARVDLVLIQTSLLLSCKCTLLKSEKLVLHNKRSEVCIKTRSTLASLPSKGQVTRQTTVKWSIVFYYWLSFLQVVPASFQRFLETVAFYYWLSFLQVVLAFLLMDE